MKNKIIDRIRRIFYTSWLGNVYFTFLLWLDRRKFNKELARRPSNEAVKISYNQVKSLYNEGMSKVKGEIAKLAAARSKEDYERVLSNVNELLQFAPNTHQEMADALYKVYVFKEKDIKSDVDMAKMVETRIQHFEDLKKHKEQRQKLREQRKHNGRS